MSDELVSGLLTRPGLRVALALATEISREARSLHRLRPAAAVMLAQGLSAGALAVALLEKGTRVNLQIECDGPLRGLFVDASLRGAIRGYVKNPQVEFLGHGGQFRWRPALGNRGFLSVLREISGGEPYRSSVELAHFDLSRDLEEYFLVSDQLPARTRLEVVGLGPEPLGVVAGMVLQPLPHGDRAELARLGTELSGGALERQLRERPRASARELLRVITGEEPLEGVERRPLHYHCDCSKERMLRALRSLEPRELEEMLREEGRADATCHFCGRSYTATKEELRSLLPPTA